MNVVVKTGDVLDEVVDVLFCTANSLLRMSGGVNGALLQRGGEAVQAELDAHLKRLGRPTVERGAVVRTGPGPLRVKHILHVVGVNVFYETDIAAVAQALRNAFAEAGHLAARTIASPMIATGYGPLSTTEFAQALKDALPGAPAGIAEFRVVVRHPEDSASVQAVLGLPGSKTSTGTA